MLKDTYFFQERDTSNGYIKYYVIYEINKFITEKNLISITTILRKKCFYYMKSTGKKYSQNLSKQTKSLIFHFCIYIIHSILDTQ